MIENFTSVSESYSTRLQFPESKLLENLIVTPSLKEKLKSRCCGIFLEVEFKGSIYLCYENPKKKILSRDYLFGLLCN